jgi:hypothetical protein
MHRVKYMKDQIKNFNMVELKPVSTSMSMATRLGYMKMVRLSIRESIGA